MPTSHLGASLRSWRGEIPAIHQQLHLRFAIARLDASGKCRPTLDCGVPIAIFNGPAQLLHGLGATIGCITHLCGLGCVPDRQAAHPVGQQIHGNRPASRLLQQHFGIFAMTDTTFHALQRAGFVVGIAGQAPALPGDGCTQFNGVLTPLLLPVDPATAALASLADRHPALE